MISSMVTPAKLRLWKNSCLVRPKNPSAAALSGLHPFALIERVRLLDNVRILAHFWIPALMERDMDRAGYDFQSPDNENRDWKEARSQTRGNHTVRPGHVREQARRHGAGEGRADEYLLVSRPLLLPKKADRAF